MSILTAQILKAVMPRVNPDGWLDFLDRAMDRFAINTPRRAAAFLAQIAYESNQLSNLSEDMNYSVQRMMRVWPRLFPNRATANQYVGNPVKLANYVYAGVNGNGDQGSGDGWRYRGRGLIHLTGRYNYRVISQMVGIDFVTNPDLVSQPEYAALTAAAYWERNGLNRLADSDNQERSFVTITRRINPAAVGLSDRRIYWNRARRAFGIS